MRKAILAIALFALLTPAFGQDNFVVTKDGVGPVKVGTSYTKVKPAMSGLCKMIWENWHDMIDMMQVTCFDNEENADMMVQFNTGISPDDKLIRSFYVYSPIFKTTKGLSTASTAKELLDAGGKLTRKEFYCYILADGVYFFFQGEDYVNGNPKSDATPFTISNRPDDPNF